MKQLIVLVRTGMTGANGMINQATINQSTINQPVESAVDRPVTGSGNQMIQHN